MNRSTMDSEVDGESPPPSPTHAGRRLPEWFNPGPFQYNGRFFLAFLPCGLIMLSLVGELLLAIIAFGAFLIHLIDTGGGKRRAVMVYLCTFIMAQITVIYSAFPLIWKSLFNIFLIFALNMFTVATGGLILIQFQAFRYEEPALAVTIETGLFGLYPAVCTVILTWATVTMTTINAAPYYLIIYGFLLLRMFITPTLSSFQKVDPKRQEESYIIGAIETAAVCLMYTLVPVVLFAVINFWSLLYWPTQLELLLVFSLPTFLSTLMGIRPFLDYQGLKPKHVMTVRWISGLTSLVIGTIILHLHGMESALLPWLLPCIISNLVFGITSRFKQWKVWSNLCGLAVIILYLMSHLKTLGLQLQNAALNMQGVSIMLILHAVITVICVFASNISQQFLNICVMIQAVVLVITENLLLNHQLYNHLMMGLTLCISAYVLIRLQDVKQISWIASWLAIAVHSTKLMAWLQDMQVTTEYGSWTVFQMLSIMAAVLSISKLLIFEHREVITREDAVKYLVAVSVSNLLVHLTLFKQIWQAAMQVPPSTPDMIASILITSGLVFLKLYFVHMSKDTVARKLNILIIFSGIVISILQPQGFLENENECSWMLVFAVTWVVAVMFSIIPTTQIKSYLFIQSVILGIPIGVQSVVILLADTPFDTARCRFAYALASTVGIYLVLLMWNWKVKSKSISASHKFKTLLSLLALFITTFLLELYLQPVGESLTKTTMQRVALPSTKFFCVLFSIVSFVSKLHSKQMKIQDPFNYTGPGKTELGANITCLLAFILAVLNCPIEYQEIWICNCSLVLLLLQEDKFCLQGYKTKYQGAIVFIAIILTLYTCTFVQCNMWILGFSINAFFEILILLLTFTTHVTSCTLVWSDYLYSSAQTICFCFPLNSLLFLVGSSYSSWLLGLVGVISGLWMVFYKVPL